MSFARVPVPWLWGFQDSDNFIRNLVTILGGDDAVTIPRGAASAAQALGPSSTAVGEEPILTLAQVKMHLRITPEVTIEDSYLTDLEMAARIHTQNYLRCPLDPFCGENIKQAMLLLIAHWYRNRETVTPGESNSSATVPLAYYAILFPERDYPVY
jgi:hypothetical protein